MSQRIHSCINNTNLDTIQCDSYATRLIQRENGRVASKSSHTRSSSAATNNKLMLPSTKNVPTRQSSHTKQEFVRKEMYAESDALVEVTVKTHKSKDRSRSTSSTRTTAGKESWGKVLKSQSSHENLLSSFTNFDPLRTIHFLAQELQSKLQRSLPDDVSIQSMVSEMNQALNRVPPNVPSSNDVRIMNSYKDKCDIKPTKLQPTNHKENYYPKKLCYTDSTCQTSRSLYVEPEKLQQHLEESSEKIEKACKQMELLCSKLKTEKEELESLLRNEKDNVKGLHRQLDEERIKFSATSALVENVQARNEQLEADMRKMQVQLESQQGPSAQELRSFIEELQSQKTSAEEQCIVLKQQLTLAGMEAEKYETILQARDSQVKEIRNEMTQLQEVVNEQLMELQNNPFSSNASSNSNITESVHKNFPEGQAALYSMRRTESRFKEYVGANKYDKIKHPSDGSITSEEIGRGNLVGYSTSFKNSNEGPGINLYDNKTSSNRNKFAEIKNQALSYDGKK